MPITIYRYIIHIKCVARGGVLGSGGARYFLPGEIFF